MKITIDTTRKEIIVEESVTLNELIEHLKKNSDIHWSEFRIISKVKAEIVYVDRPVYIEQPHYVNPYNPVPYIPMTPNPLRFPEFICMTGVST